MASDDENSEENELENINFDPSLPGTVALLTPITTDKNGEYPFQFQSFNGAVSKISEYPELLEDMKEAFTSTNLEDSDEDSDEDEAKDLGVSSGDTFWVSAANGVDKSSCNLETLALEIFNFHCDRLGIEAGKHYDPETSGAEWWTQYIEGDAEIGRFLICCVTRNLLTEY